VFFFGTITELQIKPSVKIMGALREIQCSYCVRVYDALIASESHAALIASESYNALIACVTMLLLRQSLP
jgi:hypothetical protein